MSGPIQDYRSFIASAYAAPIFALVERLEAGRGRGTPNEVQSSPFEYGYSASIIALTVFLLESFLNISKYIMGSKERSVLDHFDQSFPDSAHQSELAELFVVRDVIAHNHVWEGQIDPRAMKWINVSILSEYGDGRFRKVIDWKRRVTTTLGLHVVPTRLSYDDVRTVIKTTAAILLELRARHGGQPSPYLVGVDDADSNDFGVVTYQGRDMSFIQAADAL